MSASRSIPRDFSTLRALDHGAAGQPAVQNLKPARGAPESPLGWLITVASRRMTDQLRSEQAGRQREELIAARTPPDELLAPAADADGARGEDDTLILLMLCCHPSRPRAPAGAGR
jgi:predicted RNA polymerase sigma factor